MNTTFRHTRALFITTLLFLLIGKNTQAQTGPAPASAPASTQPQNQNDSAVTNGPAADKDDSKQKNALWGNDLPSFNPGTELVTWNGENWSIHNNRIFQARFEKYLNAPAATSEDDKAYNALLNEILTLLSPTQLTPESADKAFSLLPQCSAFDMDASLCNAIANQVYTSWQSLRQRDRLTKANSNLEAERKRLEWNSEMTAKGTVMDNLGGGAPQNKAAAGEWRRRQALVRDTRMQPYVTRIAEINALLKKNDLSKEITQLQAKIDFQALIVQLFLQRRFQHVAISTRFYRSIFNDVYTQLRVGEDAKSLFSKTTGMPPTMSTLDSMANEIMRDVDEGVKAFKFLIEKEEMQSASKRLAETFIVGEYMPAVRTLDREDKRRVLSFVQKANELLSAIDVRDYTLAEKLVAQIQASAHDFDASKPLAAIETARAVSSMHIAKAKNAAVSGDNATVEIELRNATEIWPRNPALKEVFALISSQGNVQQRALVDFDQLMSQKNYRQIYDDRVRFIAATALVPEKAEQLQGVLESMAKVEAAIIRAQEIEKRGDFIGAWESVETAYIEFPNDNKLNSVRADLTTKAADFVRALRNAEELESRGQSGAALAWFLKAQSQYPPSEMARAGIDRTIQTIFPDAI
ncbi:MAG: hypothetical protein ACK5LK_05525 [Chthoniobacterales bacterium]